MKHFTVNIPASPIQLIASCGGADHRVKSMPVDTLDPPTWKRMGVRVESSIDVRLFDWLLSSVGAEQVRLTARRLRTRLAPKPMKVARELGAEVPVWLCPSEQGSRAGRVEA